MTASRRSAGYTSRKGDANLDGGCTLLVVAAVRQGVVALFLLSVMLGTGHCGTTFGCGAGPGADLKAGGLCERLTCWEKGVQGIFGARGAGRSVAGVVCGPYVFLSLRISRRAPCGGTCYDACLCRS